MAFAKQLRLGQWQYLLIIEQPFEQLVACSTDEDSATRGAFAESTCQRVKTKLVLIFYNECSSVSTKLTATKGWSMGVAPKGKQLKKSRKALFFVTLSEAITK